MKNLILLMAFGVFFLLAGCAGERQGLVCEEMEYRLNTMTYSPDQRAYMEEELRVCREEEAQKKAEGAAQRQSIYDRFASTDSTSKKTHTASDSAVAEGNGGGEISVSEALKDSSGEKTQSIYDRYGSVESQTADSPAVDSSAADAASFQ